MINKQNVRASLVALLLMLLSACSLNLISDYDEQSLQDMERIAKQVDMFYAKLLYTSSEQRDYQQFSSDYIHIEVELNALKTRQEIRELNELTLKQVLIAQNLWQQDMQRHKKNDGISDFIAKRHRQQFNRIFLAMIKGEQSKPTSQQP